MSYDPSSGLRIDSSPTFITAQELLYACRDGDLDWEDNYKPCGRCLVCRVAATIEELEAKVESERGVLVMTVARLGGNVEGRPTERVNFLQRIDALREIEHQLQVVDSVLSRRDALDGFADRIDKINAAIRIAQTVDPKGELAKLRAENARLTQEVQHENACLITCGQARLAAEAERDTLTAQLREAHNLLRSIRRQIYTIHADRGLVAGAIDDVLSTVPSAEPMP